MNPEGKANRSCMVAFAECRGQSRYDQNAARLVLLVVMRAYLIIEEHILVLYFWHDKEFLTRLRCIYQDTVELSEDPTENAHVIESLIAPIVLSYFLLENNFDDACSVIKCPKVKCDVIFQRHNNLLFIGFCDSNEFSIYHMQKQLNVLHQLTEFFFGPCQQSIKPVNLIDKSRTWNKLTCALQSFIELHENELSFLVGGLERLQINPDLRKMYSSMVESCMKNLAQKLDRERIAFGMLFIRNKILTYETGSKIKHEISTADLLKMVALINSEHKEFDIDSVADVSSAIDALQSFSDEGSFPQRHIPIAVSRDDSHLQGTRSSSEPRSRTLPARFKISTIAASQLCNDDFVSQTGTLRSEPNLTEEDDDSDEDTIEPMVSFPHRTSRTRRVSFPAVIAGRAVSSTKQTPRRNMQMFPVFLQTASCRHTPFLMHLVQVSKDATFILLAEMKNIDLARTICQFLSLLKNIKFRTGSSASANGDSMVMEIDGGQKTYDKIASCLKQLRSNSRPSVHQMKRIESLWQKRISERLLAHFKQQRSGDLPRLEQNISELVKSLQLLFCEQFLSKPIRSKTCWRDQLEKVASAIENKLGDHLEFFHAKTFCNISIKWEHEDFPGMLHFTMVKRMKTYSKSGGLLGSGMPLMDEVFSSGLAILPLSQGEADVTELDLVMLFKNQVWKAIKVSYYNFDGEEAISEFSVADGDFRFTSYIWARPVGMASSSTLPNKLKEFRWKGKASLEGFDSPFMNVRLINDSAAPFVFFELHLLHFSTVPPSMVLKQGSRLLAKFEEMKPDF